MKRFLFLLVFAMFCSIQIDAQAKKTVRKTTAKTSVNKPTAPKVEETKPTSPSADGKFKVVGNVFRNETNYKQFVIITSEGKSSSELKKSIINILSSLFDHPDKVISTVGDDIVMVNAADSEGFTTHGTKNGDRYSTSYTYSYSLKIEIKDGKIKVNSPTISDLHAVLHFLGKDTSIGTYGQSDFFAAVKEGKVENKVENIMNTYINKLVEGLSKKDDW